MTIIACVACLFGRLAFGAPQYTVIYHFHNGPAGGSPSSLVADANDNLYGTTGSGGRRGGGTAFKLTPPASPGAAWIETILFDFPRRPQFSFPSSLALDAAGALYGVVGYGGPGSAGIVYKLIPPAPGSTHWTEQVLSTFKAGKLRGLDCSPRSSLVLDATGALYGVSGPCAEGANMSGSAIYRLTSPITSGSAWTRTIIHLFSGTKGDDYPSSLIVDSAGALYGTTFSGGRPQSYCGTGCGTVYKLTPPSVGETTWSLTVLHRFKTYSKGIEPFAPVLLDAEGNLNGTTYEGGISSCQGANNGCGTVFRLKPPSPGRSAWALSVLHRFNNDRANGSQPEAGVIAGANGVLYGTTSRSGDHADVGAVFMLTPPAVEGSEWTETVIHEFKGGRDGAYPTDLIMASNGSIYGATVDGGFQGTIFQITP